MKKLLQALLVVSSLATSAANAEIYGNRTFLAHRDELSNVGMAWAIDNHYQPQAAGSSLGATMTASLFYKQSTNHEDIAKTFGEGEKGVDAKGKISVLPAVDKTLVNPDLLYGANIDHVPNTLLGSTTNQPMSGVIALKPRRSAWGVRLDWHQDLSNLMKGLRLHISTPIEQVGIKTFDIGANSSISNSIASQASSKDGGAGNTVADYFLGDVSKTLTTDTHVQQSPLSKGRLAYEQKSVVGVGDMSVQLHLDAMKKGRFELGAGATLVIPTGTKGNSNYLFEAIAGNRGHIGLGAYLDGKCVILSRKDLRVSLKAVADWRYFIESTENRILGDYVIDSKKARNLGHYRLAMQNAQAGVFPAANVFAHDVLVTPGHQLDGLIGVSGSWKDFTFDLGYNLFLKEKEKAALKGSWKNDTYAYAATEYSMSTARLAQQPLGGLAASTDTDYDDQSPVAKHGHLIGSNTDAWADAKAFDIGLSAATTPTLPSASTSVSDMIYPGGYVSLEGPIQAPGRTVSQLSRQNVATTKGNSTTPLSGTNAAPTGGDIGTLEPEHQVTPSVCVTEAQLTHSIVGGASYKFTGKWPVIIGAGGQYEFLNEDSNTGLGGWQVWGKVGISF